MYQNLRAIHLSTALFSLLFLLAFTIGAVAFAHRNWVVGGEWSHVETIRMTPGIADARVLARAWRGELGSIETSPTWIKFNVTNALGKEFDVSYSRATGDTTVNITTKGFLRTMAFIHIAHGIWVSGSVLVSVALMILGISGLLLWFQNRSERRIGVVLVTAEVLFAAGLILSMRRG